MASSSPPDGPAGPRRRAVAEEARRRLDQRSNVVWRLFVAIFESSLRRHFHAVRISCASAPPPLTTSPLVIYCNHPSWWDACLHVSIIARLFPGRVLRGPIDARMVAKYPFMPRIGIFGVEQDEARGAAIFLAAAREIFARPSDVFVITAQGRFADPRERPVRLEPGIAHLPGLAPAIAFVPLAVEYCYWRERGAEALLRFGPPVDGDALATLDHAARRTELESALESTMDSLAVEAIARDPEAFSTVLAGARGAHPVFDAWRRLTGAVHGRRVDVGHGEAP